MRSRFILSVALSTAALAGACEPSFDADLVRVASVETERVEPGSPLVVLGEGFPLGRDARVEIDGVVRRPGAEPRRVRAHARARVRAEDRIELRRTEPLLAAVAGRGTFVGDVRVSLAAADLDGTVSGTLHDVEIDFSPATSTRLTDELGRNARALEIADFLGVVLHEAETTRGLIIGSVRAGSIAHEGGLAVGDRIMATDGVRARSLADFVPPPGAPRTILTVIRNGESRPMDVPLALDGLDHGAASTTEWTGLTVVVLATLLTLLFLAPTARLIGWLARPGPLHRPRQGVSGVLFAGRIPDRGFLARAGWLSAAVAVIAVVSATFAAIPWSSRVFPGGVDVGVLLVVALASRLTVDLMTLRAAAPERPRWLPAVLRSCADAAPAVAVVTCVMVSSGTLRLEGVVLAQGAAPWDWYVFRNPIVFAAFPAFAATALVVTHESRGRGAFVQVAGHAYLLAMCGVGAAVLFGGWSAPGPGMVWQVTGAALFVAKAWALFLLGLWVGQGLREHHVRTRARWAVPVAAGCIALTGVALVTDLPVARLEAYSGPVLASASLLVVLYIGGRRMMTPEPAPVHHHPFL